MRGHADAQQLAAFREGLLPARKAAKIAAHLSSCPRCAEVDAQLAAVTTILARTPSPPMPASLAARLDAALAAEIARSPVAASPPDAATASPAGAAPPADAASPAGAASPPGADSPVGAASPAGAPAPGGRVGHGAGPASGRDAAGRRARPSRSPWRLTPRLAAAAAAVVLVAGGGYAIARVALAGNSSEQTNSAGSSASRNAPNGSAAARAPEAAPGAAIRGGLPLVTSGTNYQPGQLPAQVGAVLKRYPAPEGAPGQPTVASPVSPEPAFPQLSACVSHLAGGQRPRLVDIARYGTRPAAVIVVPVPGTATLRVWVVGAGCTGQGGDVIARFSMPAPG
ncbi:MAG: hypothetical protein ACTHPS_09375 [Streptosporangiaceae bacterium]